MHLIFIPHFVIAAFCILVGVVALWRGETAARVLGAIYLAGYLIEFSLTVVGVGDDVYWPARALVVDGIFLLVGLGCAWRANRYWTIWVAAFSILALVSDLMADFPKVSNFAWASASLFWSLAIGAAILWGAMSSPRQRRAAA